MKNKIDFFGIIVLISTIAFLASSCDIFKDNFEAPTGVVVTKLSNNAIHVTWNKVEDAINYTIAYRSNLDSADTRRDAGTSQITTFTHYYYVSTDEQTPPETKMNLFM